MSQNVVYFKKSHLTFKFTIDGNGKNSHFFTKPLTLLLAKIHKIFPLKKFFRIFSFLILLLLPYLVLMWGFLPYLLLKVIWNINILCYYFLFVVTVVESLQVMWLLLFLTVLLGDSVVLNNKVWRRMGLTKSYSLQLLESERERKKSFIYWLKYKLDQYLPINSRPTCSSNINSINVYL